MYGLEKGRGVDCCIYEMMMRGGDLRKLATNAAGQMDVLGHDGDTLSVDGIEVDVLEEADQVGLARLLEGSDGKALKGLSFSCFIYGQC